MEQLYRDMVILEEKVYNTDEKGITLSMLGSVKV